jgi:nucleoside 2-deoxyribosyltransferase
MKIVICGSLDFVTEMKKAADELSQAGHSVILPKSAEMVLGGELTKEKLAEENLDASKRVERKLAINAIKRHYEKIKQSDAVLVVNITKKNIENYIGGNTFLEMGFAHVLDKKIFLYNPTPQMSYSDEILAMQPMILNGDISKIS